MTPAIETPRAASPKKHTRWWLAALLVAVLVAYAPAFSAEFLNYDDDRLVTRNELVVDGLTAEGLDRAFTSWHQSNWVPLVWTSHMLDVELWGMNPAGHHATNVVLHLLAVLLLFLLARRLLDSDGAGLCVALLFGLHPIHAESVAWVAERKDVLSTVFLFAATLAWLAFVRAPSAWRYACAALLLLLGLMSKQMLVTLPILLLLFDWWPLQRSAWPRGVLEKLPLFGLALGAGVATVLAQQAGGALQADVDVPLWARPLNAAIAACTYLYKALIPHELAIFVPHARGDLSIPLALGAVAVLGVLSFLAFRARAKRPYLLVGWLWYLITLLPVIGILQVGEQALAYRYTYVPLIGIYIALVAWVRDLARERAIDAELLRWGAVVLGLVLAVLTFRHASHWHDNESIWLYALESTDGNYVAHSNLSAHYAAEQRFQEALDHAQAALRIEPDYVDAGVNAAAAAANLGRYADTARYCEQALVHRPNDPRLLRNLTSAHLALGQADEAQAGLERWLSAQPENRMALQFAGQLALQEGDLPRAAEMFERVLLIAPDSFAAHFGRGRVHEALAELDAALACYATATELNPGFAPARAGLIRIREASESGAGTR